MSQYTPPPASANMPEDDKIDLATCLDVLFDHRWLIVSVTLAITLLGTAYAFMAKPVYRANILIQVEDSPGSSKNILGEMGSLFDLKTAAITEIEIIRSRFVVSHAVDNLRLYINAAPKYFPIVGAWLAGRNDALSNPGLFGYGGYAWGAEQIDVAVFNVPEALEDSEFTLTVEGDGRFRVNQNSEGIEFRGETGALLHNKAAKGDIELRVTNLWGRPGTQFLLSRTSRLATIEKLQRNMVVVEKGRQSDIINAELEGTKPKLISAILNQIGMEYVRQNLERKSEEAEKSLVFLDQQLPDIKRQLESSETKYNQFRNSSGIIDLGEEAKVLLQQSVTAQVKRSELTQKREELSIRFTSAHPDMIGLEKQLQEINREIQIITARIKNLPLVEQDVLRLMRDVKVNTDLYTSLLNVTQQLRLLKAGKVGTVRLVDTAAVPEEPIKPKRAIVIAVALLVGLFLGVVSAWIRKSLFGGIENAHEIEQALGLPVYASIPHSRKQEELYAKLPFSLTLAKSAPTDSAMEGLRSLRTAVHFSMLEAKNNIIMITGATPNLGKSFISVNFMAVLGASGKKVLLIDADFRKGYLHQYFGLDRGNGLSDLIAGDMSFEELVHKGVTENVDFISTGNLPPNASELLLHANFGKFLSAVKESYDYVLIDTPPILAVSDTLSIGPHAGTILMIARAGISTASDIRESMKRLDRAGMSVKGIVLNDVKARPGGYNSKFGRYRHTEYAY